MSMSTDQTGFGQKLLDAKQVAEMLHVSLGWVRDHSNGAEPRLPAIKLGQGKTSSVRYHPADIQAFIDAERAKARNRNTNRFSRN